MLLQSMSVASLVNHITSFITRVFAPNTAGIRLDAMNPFKLKSRLFSILFSFDIGNKPGFIKLYCNTNPIYDQ